MKALRTTLASAAVTAVVAGAAIPAVAGTVNVKSSGNQLAGTWNVSVIRPAPLPPLKSLQVFTGNGSFVEMANEWPASRTAAYGTWERLMGRLYAGTGVVFRFNPQTGAYLGTMKINRTIQVGEDGQTFAGVARVSLFDLEGNVTLDNLRVTFTGERMQVERIADLP